MLAKDLVDDAVLDSPEFACEEKVDGFRLRLSIVEGRVVSLLSRNRKRVDGHGVRWLKHLDARGLTAELDAELYVPGGTASDVSHHLAAGKKLEVAVFDILRFGQQATLSIPYSIRREIARYCVARIGSEKIRMTTSFPFARPAFEGMKANGREGVVLKRLDSVYQPGKRSWDWLKVKCIGTVDAIITDCESKPTKWTVRPGNVGTDGILYPDGKLSEPWSKGFVGLSYGYWDPVNEKPYRVGSLGVTGPKEDMLKMVGAVVELKCYSILPSGKLQHVQLLRVRTDKARGECLPPRERTKETA